MGCDKKKKADSVLGLKTIFDSNSLSSSSEPCLLSVARFLLFQKRRVFFFFEKKIGIKFEFQYYLVLSVAACVHPTKTGFLRDCRKFHTRPNHCLICDFLRADFIFSHNRPAGFLTAGPWELLMSVDAPVTTENYSNEVFERISNHGKISKKNIEHNEKSQEKVDGKFSFHGAF